MDYGQVLEFSFNWFKERESLKYIALYWLAVFVNLAIFAGLVFLFFGDIIAKLLAGDYLPAVALVMDYTALFARVIPLVLILIPITIVFWLVFLYISALMSLFALHKAGLPAAPFSFYKLLRLIALGIVSFFVAFLSLFNKIFLPILIAAIVCVVAALFSILSGGLGGMMTGGVFLLLAVFIFLVYCIVLAYNSVRLSQCGVIFLSKEVSIMDAIKESWDLTNKRFWSIFLAGLLVGIIAGIAVGIASLLLAAIIAIPLMVVSALPFEIAFSIIGQQIASFVVAPFSMLIGSFCGAAIYKNLLADTKPFSRGEKALGKNANARQKS
jgi:hypothetical protein